MQAEYGPTFEFDGAPVGMFSDGVAPQSDGLFRYTPLRSVGHLKMQASLKQSGAARCSYRTSDSVVFFTATECPKYGVLSLVAFEVRSTNAL
jgi:hypothetical protein